MTGRIHKNHEHIRHLAYQIVAQLPEETAEAILVLEYAKRLLMLPMEQTLEPIPLRVVDKEGV